MISGFTANKLDLHKLADVSFFVLSDHKGKKSSLKIDNMVLFYVGNLPIFLDYHLRFVYKCIWLLQSKNDVVHHVYCRLVLSYRHCASCIL